MIETKLYHLLPVHQVQDGECILQSEEDIRWAEF